ncbi:MAG: ABC transporter permease [Planctomycetes bacterium]|nr:ABC transporter permease [Planctomycetota bacterium]
MAVNLDVAPPRPPWKMVLRRFLRHRLAVACLGMLLLLGTAVLVIPLVAPHPFDEQYYDYMTGKPNATFWMGTDSIGRDLFVRVFRGGRLSLAVGLLATTMSVAIGLVYGAASGLAGGRIDLLLMRVVDVLYGMPYMFLVIMAMAVFQSRSMLLVFLVLGCFGWMTMARIVRGQVLSLKEQQFVEAARALGVRTPAILWRHMLPNLLGPVIVYATLTVPSVMLQESFLSFLGLGVSEPETSWGLLIADGTQTISKDTLCWWLIAAPGGLLAFTLLCLNTVGDGLRDAFDVQLR